MSWSALEDRFRRLLLVLAGCIAAGAIVELALTGHTEDPIQRLPFGLYVAALMAVLVSAATYYTIRRRTGPSQT